MQHGITNSFLASNARLAYLNSLKFSNSIYGNPCIFLILRNYVAIFKRVKAQILYIFNQDKLKTLKLLYLDKLTMPPNENSFENILLE